MHSGKCKFQRDYLYTGVEGSIMLPSGESRFIDYQDGDGCGGQPAPCDIWRCRRGDSFCHPDSFDNQTGRFTAPSDNFYEFFLTVNYFYIGASDIEGVTTTQLCRKLKENICGVEVDETLINDIALVSSTNPISALGANSVASANIAFCLPLHRGDQAIVGIFQRNEQEVDMQIFAELMIKRGDRIDPCINKCQGVYCADADEDGCECSKKDKLLKKYGVL